MDELPKVFNEYKRIRLALIEGARNLPAIPQEAQVFYLDDKEE